MICIGTQGQSVLDFHFTLSSRNSTLTCRGPIVYLEMNEPTARRIFDAVSSVGIEGSFASTFIATSVEDKALFGSCVAHWLDIAYTLEMLAHRQQRQDLVQVSFVMITNICDTLGWDYKELSNYLQNYSFGQSTS